jgi:CubicO group peptidase (beta-lactamase class C family)
MVARRRLAVRIVSGLAGLVVVVAAGGYWYERPLLLTGTGYAAHNACALQFVAGRSDAASDLPPNPLVPYLRGGADSAGHSARATVLGALAGQTAWYTPGLGCTLAGQAPAFAAPTPVPPGRNPFTAAAVPTPSAALTAALAKAFGDDLPAAGKADLGTRAVVVVKGGHLLAERYAPGFTATTPQLGWSMSKSVANLMVGRLVQQGKLAVTDSHLRPEWTDERADITIDHLMRMSSGLTWDETYSLGTPITGMLYLQPDMASFVAAQPLAHPVGSYQQYSSGSTNLLCSVLLARSGTGPGLPREQVFAPLGLSSAVWEPDVAGTPVCSSYLWATPRDWAAIGQFALQGGRWGDAQLLPADWMRRSTTVLDTRGEETGYAAGWWVNRLADGSLADPGLPADAYWADGHDGQRIYVVPSADLVVVRLGFTPGEADLRMPALVADLVAATR